MRVVCTFTKSDGSSMCRVIDWDNAQAKRKFAAEADAVLRAGGKVQTHSLEPLIAALRDGTGENVEPPDNIVLSGCPSTRLK